MAKTYTWKISDLERQLADGFVETVHWRLYCAEGENSLSNYGSVNLDRPETLIPYNDLTEDVVIGWVEAALGETTVADMKTNLSAQVDLLVTPEKTYGKPWN